MGPAPPDPSSDPSSDLTDLTDLPPPPGRLPPWADDLRHRVGLDGRAVVWVVAAVVALLVGAWLLRPAAASVEEGLPMAAAPSAGGSGAVPPADGPNGEAALDGAAPSTEAPSTSTAPTELVVHAAGAVARPGVHTLPLGARVDDLVRAAGGLAPDADPSRLNLAAPLADGDRVYVPRAGEEAAPEVVGPDAAAAPGGGPEPGSPDEPAAPIDLNTASEEELDELPGVGPAIAGAIIAFREQNGGFASVDDLLDVRGIGEAKLAEIRPLVTV